MKRNTLLAFMVLTLFSLQGCGSQDGAATTAATTTTTTTPTTTTPTTPTTTTTTIGPSLGAFTDLGDLFGPTGPNWLYAKAVALNDSGTVVGSSLSAPAAFSWDLVTGLMTDLGLHDTTNGLTGEVYADYYGGIGDKFVYSDAVDINNSGMVAVNSNTGVSTGSGADKVFTEKRAFLYNLNTDTALDLAPWVQDDPISAPGVYTMHPYSEAVAINDNGFVILNAGATNATSFAYYWDGTSTIVSATAGGSVPSLKRLPWLNGATSAEAVAINDNNQVVVNSGDNVLFHDTTNGFFQTLNRIGDDTVSEGVDINNSAQVVGTSGTLGFLWEAGAMVRIDSLGGADCTPTDINNLSVVVGSATTSAGETHAFMWKLVNSLPVTYDLGTLGGANSYATAINDAGVIVGYAETGDSFTDGAGKTYAVQHAFIWKDDVMYDLGIHNDFYTYPFLDSYPFSEVVDVNATGAIAGNSKSINDNHRAFYFDPVYP